MAILYQKVYICKKKKKKEKCIKDVDEDVKGMKMSTHVVNGSI